MLTFMRYFGEKQFFEKALRRQGVIFTKSIIMNTGLDL